MPAFLSPLISFIAGAIVSPVIGKIIDRVFGAPRLQIAVADMRTRAKRDQRLKMFFFSSELRYLLSKRPLRALDWEDKDAHFSESALDLAILETHEQEKAFERVKEQFAGYLADLAHRDLREVIYTFSCNRELCGRARSALVELEDQAPAVPKQLPSKKLFETFETEENGKKYLHLDLPGNAAPRLSQWESSSPLNQKVKALEYALSFGDRDCLADIFNLGNKHAEVGKMQCVALRSYLEKIKDDSCYLSLAIVVANLGSAPAFVSQFLEIDLLPDTPGTTGKVVAEYLDTSPPSASAKTAEEIASEKVIRLTELYKMKRNLFSAYEDAISYIVIEPNESRRLTFVSVNTIDPSQRKSIDAIRDQFIDCRLTMMQYVPRVLNVLPQLATYRKSVSHRQRLELTKWH